MKFKLVMEKKKQEGNVVKKKAKADERRIQRQRQKERQDQRQRPIQKGKC